MMDAFAAKITRFWTDRAVGTVLRRATSLAAQAADPPPLGDSTPWLSLIVDAPAASDQDKGVGVEWIAVSGSPLEALPRAKGTYVAFLQPKDKLAPHALKLLQLSLADPETGTELLYGDAFLVDDDRLIEPILKPAFDPVLYRQIDYLSNFAVYHRERLLSSLKQAPHAISGPGDQLLDCYLQGLDDRSVVHLPYPLVSTAHAPARRSSTGAFPTKANRPWPRVSILIPSRDGLELIRQTLRGVLEQTDYPALSVHVVDNGSTDPAVLALYREHQERFRHFSFEINKEEFNFSKSINRGLARIGDDHVLLLNNDVEIIDPGWLKEMVSCLDFEKTGIVGAKLLFPDTSIQHAGVIVGLNGMASHWFYRKNKDTPGPFGRLNARCSMVCVTGAVMLISKDCRTAVGNWDEENFAIAYNDVDYCLRAHKANFRVIWTPFAQLYHHESVSRGKDRSRARQAQFELEKENLKRIHGTQTFEDPVFSPWYARRPGIIKITSPKELPKPRTWWG